MSFPVSASAEFVVPEESNVSGPISSRKANAPVLQAASTSAPRPVRFRDQNRYTIQYHYQVNMLTDHFAPSALYLARNADPTPYTPISPEGIQAFVQPNDYSLRPQPYASQQAVMDFYKACAGRYGVSFSVEKGGGGGGGGNHEGNGRETQQSFELQTLGAHAHGGRGLTKSGGTVGGKNSSGSNNGPGGGGCFSPTSVGASPGNGGGSSLLTGLNAPPSPSAPVATASVEDYRVSQIRKNVHHVDRRVCTLYGTKQGCRFGDECEFEHIDS